MDNFYDDAQLRNKISQFFQGSTEAFKANWVRFRSYQRDCPHHRFTKVKLLGIFFRGIDWRYHMVLDVASNGNFNTIYPDDAYVLIENMTSSNSTKNTDMERNKQAGNLEGSQIAEVNAKLDSVHNLLMGRTKKGVHFVVDIRNFDEDELEDVNYISGAGFGTNRFTQKPFQSTGYNRTYGNSSYQSPLPKTPESKVKSMLEQLLQSQQKMTIDFNGKMDTIPE